jgi:hypothetical protein
VLTLLSILFLYGTLHYLSPIFILNAEDSAHLLDIYHTFGLGFLANFSGIFLLAVILFLLQKNIPWNIDSINKLYKNHFTPYFLLSITAILIGYLVSFNHYDFLQLKNILSILAMLIFTLIGFHAYKCNPKKNNSIEYSWIIFILLIFFAIDCVALFEVLYKVAWAHTANSSPDVFQGITKVYRASGSLFNPNLFAFWASLIYVACIWALQEYPKNKIIIFFVMLLSSFALYFSGARSQSYLLLTIITLFALITRKKSFLLACLVFPLFSLALYTATKYIVLPYVSNSYRYDQIILLGDRFFQGLGHVIHFFFLEFSKGAPNNEIIHDTLSFFPTQLPIEVSTSISGRFNGILSDNGWLVLYNDAGILGLFGLFSIFILFFIKFFFTKPIPCSAKGDPFHFLTSK